MWEQIIWVSFNALNRNHIYKNNIYIFIAFFKKKKQNKKLQFHMCFIAKVYIDELELMYSTIPY